tara:strand:+ start:4273 stop:5541 length:1269 start_codon:yes stop_codon:yes gene_type:complete
MAITEQQNERGKLYDLTRPFAWLYRSPTAVNLVYKIQKKDVFGMYQNITGPLRQPKEFGSPYNFYINPSEILADEIITQIRFKNESDSRMEFSGFIDFRLIITEENYFGSLLQYDTQESNWFTSTTAFGIDAAIQHQETFGLSQDKWLDKCRVHQQAVTNSVKFLTNKPVTTTDMGVDDSEYIYTFIQEKRIRLKISFLTNSNSSTGTPAYTPYLTYGLHSIGIGIPNIISMISLNQWNAVQPNVHKVRYVLERFNGDEVSEVGEYFVNKEKCTTERLRVYWKNRKGGIDGYTFNSELAVNIDVKSKTFQSSLGYRRANDEDVNSAGYIVNNTYGSDTRNIGSTNIMGTETISVTSKFHKQETLKWLSEIITSPQVWIENLTTGNLNSVYSIQSKAILKPKGKSLGQMKLKLRMSNELMTQR